MTHSRYALYLTPPPDSDLWRFGCDIIGRDAATGGLRDGFAPEGYELEAWRQLTSEPRRYGFHATLKAPFRLRADLDVVDLMDRVAAFARTFQPFEAGELQVGAIPTADGRAFCVLKPAAAAKALHALERGVVRRLDMLRAPMTAAERRRTEGSRLTPRQRYYLDAWGRPYVLDEFRPHFTLTNAVADPDRMAKALEWEFNLRVPSRMLLVDALTLFGESEPGGDFTILRRFPLGGSKRAHRLSPRVALETFLD